MKKLFLMAVLCLLANPNISRAQWDVAFSFGTGYTMYQLDSLNAEIHALDLALDFATDEGMMNNMDINIFTHGFTFDIGCEIKPVQSQFALAVALRFLQSNKILYMDSINAMSFDATAYSFEINPKLYFKNSPYYIGMGIGHYTSTGEIIIHMDDNTYPEGKIDASCLGYSFFLGLKHHFNESLAADVNFGYRWAATDDVTIGESEMNGYSMDWSGVFARAALNVFI